MELEGHPNLPTFLRTLATQLEQNTLTSSEQTLVSEFYMSFKTNGLNVDPDMKYYTLGLYVYEFLMPKSELTDCLQPPSSPTPSL